ncbi:family 16 glycosylhydrolase [Sphingobacterium sp.]|uniref:family 16 glycosylhydrolase n=1 Tax=Sphingobacterium sp. TaxID=341027 RepID=UPI0028AA47B5|nr:family 16 glycosylhydrolase [Sphingobacterium sp.]
MRIFQIKWTQSITWAMSLFTLLGMVSCEKETTITENQVEEFKATARAATYSLVWSDEFNYSGQPNSQKWSHVIWNPGQVNNEKQAYTNRLENTRVENGNLIIEARRDWGNGHEYTSGRLNSKAGWTYGRMEARIKIPSGWGTWPAFWLYPNDETKYGWNNTTNYWWPNCGEIDILEHVGKDQNNIHGSVHSRDYYFRIGNQRTGKTYVGDATSNYHVYAVEWSPDRIDFFVDNNKYYTVHNDYTGWGSWPFNHDFHIILNLAVGGDWGGDPDPNIWPRRMEVDYVRVYKMDNTSSPIGRTVTLKGSNNQFVSGQNGTNPVMCNRPNAQAWEQFTVVDAGNGKVALRSMNKYLSSENGLKSMTCSRDNIGDWEKFTWEVMPDGKVALKGNNGKYVSSENGLKEMTCQRDYPQAWETFTYN